MIQLSTNWRIVTEDSNNCVLQFHEIRTRKNKETKEEQDYEYTDDYFYPSVKTALKRWLQEDIKDSESVAEILQKIDLVEQRINQICK